MTGIFLSVPRYDWCTPLSHPSSCVLVNHGPSQQSSKEYTARYYASHTNEEVRAKIQQAIGPHEDLLTTVKRRKLQWYGHVFRSSSLAKTTLQGTVNGGRRQGRQRKRWEDNIREWTGLESAESQRAVENREKWRKLVAKSSVVLQRPSRLRDRWDEMMSSRSGHCLVLCWLVECTVICVWFSIQITNLPHFIAADNYISSRSWILTSRQPLRVEERALLLIDSHEKCESM